MQAHSASGCAARRRALGFGGDQVRLRRFDVDRDVAPLLLPEPCDAQRASRQYGRTIAIQMYGCRPTVAWKIVQSPSGTTICDTIEMYSGLRVSPVP